MDAAGTCFSTLKMDNEETNSSQVVKKSKDKNIAALFQQTIL